MLPRVRPYLLWLCPLVLVSLVVTPAPAQPPSPLELVRGLREHGSVDLALEYLKELEGKPLSADDKAAILLERAKCLLEASEDEADEATRTGMVSEARESLNAFLTRHANHPRSVEARLTNAKLVTLDAREQLNRARRMDIPPPGEGADEIAARDAAMEKQKAEAAKARPMFLLAAKQFAEASAALRARLDDKTLDPIARRALQREAFEAELASGINQFDTAETYMPPQRITGAEKEERNKFLEQAKATFDKLAKGPTNSRTVWVARAWSAQVTFEQDKYNDAAAEVAAILRAGVMEAEDGKRLARFFQLQRNWLNAMGGSMQDATRSETEIRNWLRAFGNPRKPTPEVYAVRYYLGRVLQRQAGLLTPPSKDPKKPTPVGKTALGKLEEAEKLFRALAQTDHDYTARATRQRMIVVFHLLGDADHPPASYESFEKAQMASLIQMSKLADAEAKRDRLLSDPKMKDDKAKVDAASAEVRDRQFRTVALLERSRELATPQDSPSDVTDVLLRLIYFYQLTDQPYRAAVLGEHVARTIKSTGGKAAVAGLFGLNNYIIASRRVKSDDPEELAAARHIDRERAVALARFLDEKYPNDNATDAARHQLASMLVDDKEFMAAFEVLLKVRPAYQQINNVRLLEGYLASVLVNARPEQGKPAIPEAKRAEIFKRAVTDLAKASRPANVALEDDVRGYLLARWRLAGLLLAQGRADPKAEAANPGAVQAIAIANDMLAAIPTFNATTKTEGGAKILNYDGMEMSLLGQEVRARALYLRARALIDAGNLDEAAKVLQPTIDEVEKNGPLYDAKMREWSTGAGEDGVQKAKVAQFAGEVDRSRVNVILTAFRIKVQQAKAAEAEAMLNLMVKAGGSVEESLPLLEPVGRELAARMVGLRKEGKKAEADALGAGLAVLLKKITTVPKLPQQTTLFVGQMLIEVREFDKALELLKKIPPPDYKDWETKKPDEIPQELRGRVQNQIRDFAVAQLGTARALRESKKFDEAEKLLQGVIGTPEKPGWGSGRMYFRKELAELYEAKGAATADPKAANTEWGKALREWMTIFGMYRARLQKPPPGATPQQMVEYRNAFADAFFDVNQCLVKANQQLLAGPANAAKLQKTYDDTGKKFVDMEKQIPAADWQPEVQHRYADLLKEIPSVAAAYKAAGGKLFLEKLPLNP